MKVFAVGIPFLLPSLRRLMKPFLFILPFVLSGATHASVILDINNSGYLTGARNIDVDGTLYDVTFQDGSCIDIYGGCDQVSDFTFTDRSSALAASQALLDVVFLDGSGGNFDSQANLTFGCTGGSGAFFECDVLTPFGFYTSSATGLTLANLAFATNGAYESNDAVGPPSGTFATNPGWDLSTQDDYVYARWTIAQPTAVPVPAAAWLFGSAVIGLIGFKRRK